jgi:CTP:molybdopterin cytidylyltransferase MocA
VKPALVILAAGRSARLGTCKATVLLDERSGLEHLLAAASESFDGEPALVVTGAHDEEIARMLPRGAERLFHAGWASGRTGGLVLASARRPGRDLCVAPVDCPLVSREVFEALLGAWLAHGAPAEGWLAPCHGEGTERRDGHPIVLGRDLAGRLQDLPADHSLRLLRENARPRLSVAVADEAIHDELDSPQDLLRLRRRLSGRSPPNIPEIGSAEP